MSLLLNLINYSSSMQGQYSLSLPTMDAKDNRSRSLCLFGDQEENKKSKITSKSLSKLLNEKPQQAIDPKTRILHRISHSLFIKCKKHYYAFFVTLQTLKKKDLYLTPQGQFEKMESRKLTFNEKDTKNKEKIRICNPKEISPEKKSKILSKFAQKLLELNGLIIVKDFEQNTKAQFFYSIKNNHLYKDKVDPLVQNLEKCLAKLNCYRVFKTLKKINQYAFKIQILSTLLANINKKYNKINPFDEFSIKENAFQVLRNFQPKPKNHNQPKKCQEKEFFSENNSAPKVVQEQQTFGNFKPQKNAQSPQKQAPKQIEIASKIKADSKNNQNGGQKVPLQSLQAKILCVEQRKFERNQRNMLKSYLIKTCLQEEPTIVSKNIKIEKASNFCNKIAKNYLISSPNDQDEEINPIFTSAVKQNSFSSRLKESKVTPYQSNKFSKTTLKSFNLDLNSSDEKAEDFTISQISGITLLRNDKSTSTIVNDKSLNSSNAIGTECVNFKNSLVQERESLKDADKNFTKKRPANLNKSDVEGRVFTKSFLRSTIDNKGKAKGIETINADRTYSGNKASEFLIKHEGPFTEMKPQNRAQELNWMWTPDMFQEEKLNETELDNSFMKVNMSMLSNQRVFPTRDISGVGMMEAPIKSTPYVPKQGDKEKGFIKLLSSKKDTSMISKN